MLLLSALVAFAQEPFTWELPSPPPPVLGECGEAVDLVAGQPVPPSLVGEDGLVRCHATAVPASDLADLLLVDAWALQAEPRGHRLELELEWERERYQRLSTAFDKPVPWLQRPQVQRNLGRVESLVVIALGITAVAVLDSEVIQ